MSQQEQNDATNGSSAESPKKGASFLSNLIDKFKSFRDDKQPLEEVVNANVQTPIGAEHVSAETEQIINDLRSEHKIETGGGDDESSEVAVPSAPAEVGVPQEQAVAVETKAVDAQPAQPAEDKTPVAEPEKDATPVAEVPKDLVVETADQPVPVAPETAAPAPSIPPKEIA